MYFSQNTLKNIIENVLTYIKYILYKLIYSEVMKAIQCVHLPGHHIGFVATCRLWTASGGVHALLVLEPTSSTSAQQALGQEHIY